jgi:hypothetical protein
MTEREQLQQWIGLEAEAIVYLFCTMDRHHVVIYTLLKNGHIPPEGLEVPHLRLLDQTVFLSPELLQLLLLFTMADVADQNFGWQDTLFGTDDTTSMFSINDDLEQHQTHKLWPGISKPGLWMSYMSDLCRVAKTFDNPNRHLPPVFDHCTKTVSRANDALARDYYWSVISEEVTGYEETVEALTKCHQANPWVYEPLTLLGQKYLETSQFELARQVTEEALELQRTWGTNWDKRMSFVAWVAWTRVLHQRAVDQEAWPTNSWKVLNLGLVTQD